MKKLLAIGLVLAMTLTLFLGCSRSDNTESTGEDDETPVGDWWVLSEAEKNKGGISILTRFKLGDQDDAAVSYDDNGQEIDTYDVTREGDMVTLDLNVSTVTLRTDGKKMYDPETGDVIFIRTDDPGFAEKISYEGTWNKNGQKDGDEQLIFKDNTYRHLSGGEVREESTWEYGPSTYLLGPGVEIHTLPQLKAEFPGPTFYPVTRDILYAEDFMDYVCYVSEKLPENDQMAKYYVDAAALMNAQWSSPQDGFRYLLTISPNIFQVIAYAKDKNGYENPNDDLGRWAGSWSINENGEMVLDYKDGTTDSIPVDPEAEEISLPHVGAVFTRS